jgi:hypothetical protein
LVSDFLLFLKALLNLLSDGRKLSLLLVPQLLKQITDLVETGVVPFLVLGFFKDFDLLLYLVSLEVILLFCEVLLDFPQVHQLRRIFMPAA